MLGLLQGFAELFPISSLGHSVIAPPLFGWDIHQNDEFFITFLVATHLATAIVLLAFFWQDWKRITFGLGRSLRDRQIADPDARLGWLLVVGTIPAGNPRDGARASPAQRLRLTDLGRRVSDHQRAAAVRRRATATARTTVTRR